MKNLKEKQRKQEDFKVHLLFDPENSGICKNILTLCQNMIYWILHFNKGQTNLLFISIFGTWARI